jgi:hypothetical protein
MKVKFLSNPPEQIYTVGLTKHLFVYYCLVENSKKSKLGVFNYINPSNFKS